MNLLNNVLVHAFFEDMVDVGLPTWAGMAGVFALFTFSVWGNPPFFMLDIVGLVMTLNLLMATYATIWWDRRGRDKYAYTSLTDLGEQMQRGGQ